MIFLKRKLYLFHWFGMFLVLIGLVCVGAASFLLGSSFQFLTHTYQGSSNDNASHPIRGDIIIVRNLVKVTL